MKLALRIVLAAFMAGAAVFGGNELVAYLAPEPKRPIIAQIFAAPHEYIEQKIEIYGLVIESSGDTFLLQDVSQRPLKVRGNARAGDQLTVVGTLSSEANSLIVIAESLRATKVVAGGGCC